MSMTLYLKNGAPAGARPRAPSQQLEHPAKFRRAHLLRQDRLHLLQAEAEVLQRDDAVQLGELARLIETVAAGRIDAGGPEQPDRVVVPEHPDRDAAVPCELPDTEHDVFRPTASHGVRVNLRHDQFRQLLVAMM